MFTEFGADACFPSSHWLVANFFHHHLQLIWGFCMQHDRGMKMLPFLPAPLCMAEGDPSQAFFKHDMVHLIKVG